MGKQQRLKGTEDKRFPDVEEAAEAYRDVRDERMELTEKEIDAKSELMARMKEHKLKTYRIPHSGLEVEVVAGEETVKVRKIKDDAPPADKSESDAAE